MTIGGKVMQAINETQGTNNYNKYYMECYTKIDKRWKFIGWSYPSAGADTIKRHGKETYIMFGLETKYKVTDAVKELLSL